VSGKYYDELGERLLQLCSDSNALAKRVFVELSSDLFRWAVKLTKYQQRFWWPHTGFIDHVGKAI